MGDSMSAMLFAFCHLSLESLDVSLDVSSLTFDGLSVIRTIGGILRHFYIAFGRRRSPSNHVNINI